MTQPDQVLEILNRAIHELEAERARRSEELAQLDCTLAALREQRQLPLLHSVQDKPEKTTKNG